MKIGIDLGGTKIECVVLSETNEVVFRERTATPKGDYLGTLQAIAGLVQQTESIVAPSCPVGVGIPGTLSSKTSKIKNANSVCLIGQALDRDLSKILNRSVRLANDANCFAWSEYCDGAAQGATNVFGVIIGTGVGGGLVVNHQLVNGNNGIAGEWGHNPLIHFPHEGRDCYCGKQDCVETYLSGPSFESRFQETYHQPLSSQDIVALSRTGNTQANAHLNDYAQKLAANLTGVINLLDPDIIVLGGGMSNIPELYQLIPHFLKTFVFSDTLNTKIVKARHGDSSGVRGAAWLWN
jgi:fructokinase